MFNQAALSYREQFTIKSGNDCINIGSGWLLFSNGATMERSPYGVTRDPPTDEFERSKLVVKYYEELARRAVDAFQELRTELRNAVHASRTYGNPPPAQSRLDQLREFQKRAQTYTAKLAAARKEMEKATPDHIKQGDASKALTMQVNDQFSSLLDEIKL